MAHEQDPPGHSHKLPLLVIALLGVCIAGLLAGIILMGVSVHRTNARLASLEEYVEGRGEYRDREADALEGRMEESVRQGLCDLLDQFPGPSRFLDGPRAKYGCGPGVVTP
jgi:hypothetical protein